MNYIYRLINFKKVFIIIFGTLGIFSMFLVIANSKNATSEKDEKISRSTYEAIISSNIKNFSTKENIIFSSQEKETETKKIAENLKTDQPNSENNKNVSEDEKERSQEIANYGPILGDYKSINENQKDYKTSYTELPLLTLGINQFQGIIMSYSISKEWLVIKKTKSNDTVSFNIDPIYTTFITPDGTVSDLESLSIGRNVKITISSEKNSEPYEALVVEFLN